MLGRSDGCCCSLPETRSRAGKPPSRPAPTVAGFDIHPTADVAFERMRAAGGEVCAEAAGMTGGRGVPKCQAFTQGPPMLPPIAAFLSPKGIIREKMKAERRRAAAQRPDAARHAAANFLARIPLQQGAVVAIYHSIGDELDTGPLAAGLLERGARLALPVVEARNAPLVFRQYDGAAAALVEGRHGAMTPPPESPIVRPDIVATPLLAFTLRGDRLGYGGGYYDRTLAQLRAEGEVLAVGFGYGAQQVDALPAGPLDQRLDWIVTEREAFRSTR